MSSSSSTATTPQRQVEIEWKPFMIDPGTQLQGETVQAYCRRRWGGDGWTRDLKRQGQRDGAQFANWQWWPHTLRAHQLVMYLSQNHGVSTDAANRRLFRAEYEEGRNLSDVETLVAIGQELLQQQLEATTGDGHQNSNANVDGNGSAEQEFRDYLTSNRGAQDVQRDIAQGRQRYRITGVPFFVVSSSTPDQRPYGLSGAQSADTFLHVFQELLSSSSSSHGDDKDENENDE